MKHYVTFGQDHIHLINGQRFDKDTVATFEAEDPGAGRKKAFDLFGPKFCLEYHGSEWNKSSIHYFPKGYVEVKEQDPEDENIYLTIPEAESILPEGDAIHTFVNPNGGMIIGVEHRRESVLENIRNANNLQLGGDTCKAMGHALVINSRLFVEADKKKVQDMEILKTNFKTQTDEHTR